MDLHLNRMTEEQIAELCRRDPDRILEITLCMAEAVKLAGERMYCSATAFTDAIHGNDPETSGLLFDDLVDIIGEGAKVTNDTLKIYRAVTEGARRSTRRRK